MSLWTKYKTYWTFLHIDVCKNDVSLQRETKVA